MSCLTERTWRGRATSRSCPSTSDEAGVELVREAVDHPAHRDLAWFLTTKGAYDLYARFGFRPPSERTMVRVPIGQMGRSSGRSTSRGAANGTSTSSTQSGWEAISSRAPTSPCR